MDRDIVMFTKGRLLAANSIIKNIVLAFNGQPFAKHVKDAMYAINRADEALEAELAAIDSKQSTAAIKPCQNKGCKSWNTTAILEPTNCERNRFDQLLDCSDYKA